MNFLLQSIPLLLYTHHARFVKSESLRTIHSIRQLRQGEVLPYITPSMYGKETLDCIVDFGNCDYLVDVA